MSKKIYIGQAEWYDDDAHDCEEPICFKTKELAEKWAQTCAKAHAKASGIDFSNSCWEMDEDGKGYHLDGMMGNEYWYHWKVYELEIVTDITTENDGTRITLLGE